jgi:hypothetical protein
MTDNGYVINTIQNPQSLKPIYDSIERGNTTDEAIQEDTALSSSAVDEGMKGLQRLALLDSKDEEYKIREYTWSTGQDMLDFQLTALENLAESLTPPDWGKHAVFLLNYAYLIKEDSQRFKDNDASLRRQMDQWEQDTLDYYPMYRNDRIDLNKNKMENWGRLAMYLGLLHKYDSREYIVSPAPAIIYQSIKRACAEEGRTVNEEPTIELPAYLDWLRTNLLYLPNDINKVPTVFSRALYTLLQQERIKLVELGDQGAVDFERMPAHDRRESAANTIVLTSGT